MDIMFWTVVYIVVHHNVRMVNTDADKFSTAGETVKLYCRTELDAAVDWKFQGLDSEKEFYIYSVGVLVPGYDERFYVETPKKGDYSLVIRHALQGDSGLYTCTENGGFGERHVIRLNVTAVVCSTYPPSDNKNIVIPLVVVIVLLLVALVVVLVVIVVRRNVLHGKQERNRRTANDEKTIGEPLRGNG